MTKHIKYKRRAGAVLRQHPIIREIPLWPNTSIYIFLPALLLLLLLHLLLSSTQLGQDHWEEWCKVISCRDSVQPCSYKSPCRGVITSTQLWPVIQAWRARWVVKNLLFSIIVYSGSLATKPVDLEELVTSLLHFWEDWCIMRVCGSLVQAWAWKKTCWVIYIYKPLGLVIFKHDGQAGVVDYSFHCSNPAQQYYANPHVVW